MPSFITKGTDQSVFTARAPKDIPAIAKGELTFACINLSVNRAPSLILNQSLKATIKAGTKWFISMFNILKEGTFGSHWKTQMLMLMLQPNNDKPFTQLPSYHLIC